MALATVLIARNNREIFPPIPNYLDSDRFKDCIATDTIRIENNCHRVSYGRVGGFTPPGPRAVVRLWLISGALFGGFENPQSDEKIIRMLGRSRLCGTDAVPDYAGEIRRWIVLRSFCRDVRDASRIRISPRVKSAGSHPDGDGPFLPVAQNRMTANLGDGLAGGAIGFTPIETDSLPPWLDRSSEGEEQN